MQEAVQAERMHSLRKTDAPCSPAFGHETVSALDFALQSPEQGGQSLAHPIHRKKAANLAVR
jgi:hypothetical protein